MNLNMMRRGLRVIRFHTEPTLHPETVGHHSAGVAAILIFMHAPRYPSAEVLMAAITHDMPEYEMGDIPATAKWRYQVIADEVHRAETAFYLNYGIPDPNLLLCEDDIRMLKIADSVDLALRCMEEQDMGNKRALEIQWNVYNFLKEYIPAHPVDSQYRDNVDFLMHIITPMEEYNGRNE